MIKELDKISFCSWYRQKTITLLFENPVTTCKSLHLTTIVGLMAGFIPRKPTHWYEVRLKDEL